MMETVDVRVTIFWCGETKQISVPVEVQSFEPGKRCARSIAAIKAAALMGVPFTEVLRIGSFEMLKEDKTRLRELFGKREETTA